MNLGILCSSLLIHCHISFPLPPIFRRLQAFIIPLRVGHSSYKKRQVEVHWSAVLLVDARLPWLKTAMVGSSFSVQGPRMKTRSSLPRPPTTTTP